MYSMSNVPKVFGENGFEMPILGFGTWQVDFTAGGVDLESILDTALEAGYRLIDTAYAYLNEDVIGNVLKKWLDAGKLKREELFVVTKLPFIGNRPEHIGKFLDLSLKKLKLDYVDLYLVHGPFGLKYHSDDKILPYKDDGTADLDLDTDIIGVWKEMENQVVAEKARWIGVSNFNNEQIERLLAAGCTLPAVNQIQLNAYLQQPELVKNLQDKGIVVMSYSTLGSPGLTNFYKFLELSVEITSILKNNVVLEVADEVGKTPAQVLLRHMIQKNIVVIPKSVSAARIKENFDLFGFELNASQMDRLNDLNQNIAIVDFKDFLKGVENHPEYPYA